MVFLQTFLVLHTFFILLGILPQLKPVDQKASLLTFSLNITAYVLVLVLCYSIYQTKGHTVFLTAIPAFTYMVFTHYPTWTIQWLPNKSRLKFLGITLLVVNSIFIVKALTLFQLHGEYLKIPHPDYIFYAKLSSFFQQTGIESYTFDIASNPTPYHYFEIALNAFFTTFGLQAYASLMLLTYPILLTLCFLLSLSFFHPSKIRARSLLFGLSILFIHLLLMPILKGHVPFLDVATTYLVSPWDYQKLAVIYLVILLALLGYKYGKLDTFFCIAALFPSLYGTLFFATAGLMVAALVLKIKLKAHIHWASIACMAISLVLYQWFYQINTSNNDLQPLINTTLFGVAIKNFASTCIRLGVFMLPYMVLFGINKNKVWPYLQTHQHLVMAFALALLASFSGWSLFHLQTDALQLFSNFGIPAICIGICFLLRQISWQKQLAITLVAIAINYHKFLLPSNLSLLQEARPIFSTRQHGVYFKNEQDYTNPYNISPHYANPLSFVYLINPQVRMTDLSIVEAVLHTSLDTPIINSTLARNEYNHYLQSQHDHGIAAQINFIKSHDISFLICPKDYALPLALSNLFKHQTSIDNQVVWY